ncbi:DUF1275 family protein [Pantoea osteomyelitidis]|uniref:DUF1275 family protein n=1 Tax=Pantoea osteomyelitidis TaxID=3230026 RepID=A0ABW7PTQ4_9GAMM
MTQPDREQQSDHPEFTTTFVLLLVSVAGLADAALYLHSKELLAVYMTGNTSKLAQFIQQGNVQKVLPLLTLILAFLASTTFAAWLGNRLGRWRAPVLLLLVAGLLGIAWPASDAEYPLGMVVAIALGMGTLNQISASEPGVTFITGTLVKLGRQLASGEFSLALPLALRWLVWLIAAFIGALLDHRYPQHLLLFIALWCLLLAGSHLLLRKFRAFAPSQH